MAKSFGQSFSESFGKVLPQTLQSSAQLAAIQQQRELQLGLQYESQKNNLLTQASEYESKGNYLEASNARKKAQQYDKLITGLYGGNSDPVGTQSTDSTSQSTGNRFHPIQSIKSGVKKIFHPAEISGTPNVKQTEQYIKENNIDVNNPPQNVGITEDYSDVADPNNPNIIGGIDTTGYDLATKKKVIDAVRAKQTVKTNRQSVIDSTIPKASTKLRERAEKLLTLDLNDDQFNKQLENIQKSNLQGDRQLSLESKKAYLQGLKSLRTNANPQSIGKFKYGDIHIPVPFAGGAEIKLPGAVDFVEDKGKTLGAGITSGLGSGALIGAQIGGKAHPIIGTAIGAVAGGAIGAGTGAIAGLVDPSAEEQAINDLYDELPIIKGYALAGGKKPNQGTVTRAKVPNPNQEYRTFDREVNQEIAEQIDSYEKELILAEQEGFTIPDGYYQELRNMKDLQAKYANSNSSPASAKNTQPQQPKLKDFKNPKKVQSMIDSGMIDFKSAGPLINKAIKSTGQALEQPVILQKRKNPETGLMDDIEINSQGTEIIYQGGKDRYPKPATVFKKPAGSVQAKPVAPTMEAPEDDVQKQLQNYYQKGTPVQGKPPKGNVSSNQAGFINTLAKKSPSLQTIATLANTIQSSGGAGINKELINQLDKDGLHLLDLALMYIENGEPVA